MLDDEPQTIIHTSANVASNGNGAPVSTPSSTDAALAPVLAAFYALSPDAQAEFLRRVAPRRKSPVSTLGIFKEGPLHDVEIQVNEERKRVEAMEREATEDDAE